jgi:hypothetical protein
MREKRVKEFDATDYKFQFRYIKNAISWDVTPCGFVRTDVSDERAASIIKVTRIGDLGTTLA